MADTANIKAKKYNSRIGQFTDISFLASKHVDGYCYFNDDFYYRCKPNGIDLQIFDPLNKIWVPSNKIYPQTIDNVDVSKIINMAQGLVNVGTDVSNLINGSGSIAPNASVEAAVIWAIKKASHGITYAYNPLRSQTIFTDSYAYDCSSFVITAFYLAGFTGLRGNTSYTGDMRQAFMNIGFQWIPGYSFPASSCKRGDILLKYTNPGDYENHTEIYIGNNQDCGVGGANGEIFPHVTTFVSMSGYTGWDGILRYAG